MNYFQHGDIILKEHGPVKGNALKQSFLFQSSPTANKHYCSGGSFKYLETDKKELFLEVKKATQLKHVEHKPIKVPKGVYKIEIVNEFDHWKEETKKVVD